MAGYVDVMMARVFDHNHVVELAKWSSVPVINGLSDYNHPCQGMADALTIQEKFGKGKGSERHLHRRWQQRGRLTAACLRQAGLEFHPGQPRRL
jgi:ornithine carbamoyltransferase